MDEIQSLLAAANRSGVSAKCAGCGQKGKWVSLGRLVDMPLVAEDGDALDSHRMLAIACGQCGLVRLHSAAVLDQYLDPRAG